MRLKKSVTKKSAWLTKRLVKPKGGLTMAHLTTNEKIHELYIEKCEAEKIHPYKDAFNNASFINNFKELIKSEIGMYVLESVAYEVWENNVKKLIKNFYNI